MKSGAVSGFSRCMKDAVGALTVNDRTEKSALASVTILEKKNYIVCFSVWHLKQIWGLEHLQSFTLLAFSETMLGKQSTLYAELPMPSGRKQENKSLIQLTMP